MKMRLFSLILFVWALLFPFQAAADEREEPIDVIIALDKSKSMAENNKIEAVKEYVNDYIIDDLLIEGDFFLVVAFYGQTQVPVSLTISGPRDKERAKQIIGSLLADGVYTDIGNALDVLGEQVQRYGHPDRKKFLLLITDGIQEAPPESKYYSPDGSFNHAFLENTKVIQKKGWKVQILGIGTHEQAEELAEELAGTYVGTSEQPTAEELAEKSREFLAALEISGEVTMSPVDERGRSTIRLSVESKGYTEEKTVAISGVRLSLPDGMEQNILSAPISSTIEPESTTRIDIPVRIPSPPASGDHTGTVRFVFASEVRFLPVIMEVSYHVNSFVENYWLWILAGVVLLAALIVLIVLLTSRLKKAKYRFRLVTGAAKPQKGKVEQVYRIVEGKPLYLVLSEDQLQVEPKRTPNSIARLQAIQKGVRMSVLKSEHFPKLHDAPVNILDFDFQVRLDLDKKKDIPVRLDSGS